MIVYRDPGRIYGGLSMANNVSPVSIHSTHAKALHATRNSNGLSFKYLISIVKMDPLDFNNLRYMISSSFDKTIS